MKKLFSVSFLIPTLNAAETLKDCLQSISGQDYPKEKIEIIIADGGSIDRTLEIAKKYGAKIYQNPMKTAEAGKAVALRQAQGGLVALIDSDNILPDKNWLRRMIKPFSDPEIIGSEPWEFTYRRKDGFIDRYCALLGMNDPLCLFLGNYDRKSVLTGRWTDLPVEQEDKGGWLKITLKRGAIPTIGANGTILRRKIFRHPEVSSYVHPQGDYLFDVDIIASLASRKSVKFAKVKTGIVHLYCDRNIKKFISKQTRRIRDYLYYQNMGLRKYPWLRKNKIGILKFIFACLTVVPLIYQTFRGYGKKPDSPWFFHPLACWLTLFIYARETILAKLRQTIK